MLTYEEKKTEKKLETYEWDNTWWDNSNTDTVKHVLVIGDSISVGYRHKLVDVSEKTWCVDGFATSKAIDNDFFLPSIDMFMAQQKKYDFVLFNNGLHGWHLSSDEYAVHYKAFVAHLKEKGIPMAIVLTTPVRDKDDPSLLGDRCKEIIARNEKAVEIANEFSVPYIDTYALLVDKRELYTPDGVHLISDGYDFLTKILYEKITSLL